MSMDGGFEVAGDSVETVWHAVLKRLKNAGWNETVPSTMQGEAMFGLSLTAVLLQLEKLPLAHQCKGYKFTYFEPVIKKTAKRKRINTSGCARTEPFSKELLAASQEDVCIQCYVIIIIII